MTDPFYYEKWKQRQEAANAGEPWVTIGTMVGLVVCFCMVLFGERGEFLDKFSPGQRVRHIPTNTEVVVRRCYNVRTHCTYKDNNGVIHELHAPHDELAELAPKPVH